MRNGSSIRTGKFSDFSDDLRAFLAGKNGKLARNHWKKSEDFPAGILLQCFADFQRFLVGTGSYFLTWVVLYVFIYRCIFYLGEMNMQ